MATFQKICLLSVAILVASLLDARASSNVGLDQGGHRGRLVRKQSAVTAISSTGEAALEIGGQFRDSGPLAHMNWESQEQPESLMNLDNKIGRHNMTIVEEPHGIAQGSSDSSSVPKPATAYTSFGFLMRVVTGLVLVQLFGLVLFELVHQRWTDIDFNQTLPPEHEQQTTALRHIFAGLPTLVRPYFSSPAGRKGMWHVTAMLTLGLIGLFVSYVHNMWQKHWWDMFNNGESSQFGPLCGGLVAIVIAGTISSVYLDYIQTILFLHWRDFMTKRLTRQWLDGHAHFLMQLDTQSAIDNPDQRIQEDVERFVGSTISIVLQFFQSCGSVFVFVPVVLVLSPPRMFGLMRLPGWLLYIQLLYSLLGTLLTHCIGQQLIRVKFSRQRFEADFRHQAMHIREHAESITLYNSEANEEETLRMRFEHIKLIWWQQMQYTKRLSFFTVAYDYANLIVPFLILAPSYFKKEISLGDLFQLTGALGHVKQAFDWFISVYPDMTDWRATADRLLSFEKAVACAQKQGALSALAVKYDLSGPKKLPAACVESVEQHGRPAASAHEDNSSRDLASHGDASLFTANINEVRLPNGDLLLRDVSVEILSGQKVLISGQEGIGKSILFKALAGVWPFVEGSDVRLPVSDKSEILFVPQRPALPSRCSLRQASSYPEFEFCYSDEAICSALHAVGLKELLEGCSRPSLDGHTPEKGLDQVDEWPKSLSPGMQQQLAIAHVLLRRPKVLFLDEAVANVCKETIVALYTALNRHLPEGAAIISISHDVPTLLPLHDVHIEVSGRGELKKMHVNEVSATA